MVVERVTPDPPGENEVLARLVSLDRQGFVRFLYEKTDAAREENGPMCAA